MKFTIPACPMTLNKLLRAHWSVRAKEQRRWQAYLGVARLSLPKPERVCVDPAIVSLTFVSPRRRDPDGLAKCVLDAIVHVGLIKDDSPTHLVELRLRSERGSPETRIEITPA